jgi:hypothetical protein
MRIAPPSAAKAEEADMLVRAMTDVLAHERPDSTAEALRVLRLAFPEYPLAIRLVAVASVMKWADRLPHGSNGERRMAST